MNPNRIKMKKLRKKINYEACMRFPSTQPFFMMSREGFGEGVEYGYNLAIENVVWQKEC